ncbi:MAG: endonuclease/exonuclease/phosphatase family protein, partial [Caldisericia bacterium]|nr:endonuclease/exonuclease/phosphatase family protein [Caldisericia bacterium]
MIVATWNVNSIKMRMEILINWLKKVEPDFLCLQETKVRDEEFPKEELERLG